MESQNQQLLSFRGVDIVHVDFDIKRPFHVHANVKVVYKPLGILNPSKRNQFNIIMDLQVKVEEFFELNLCAIGSFQLSEETS